MKDTIGNPAIIHEDNHIMVVIKPQNVPSQPDASHDPDMLTILKQHRKVAENKSGEAFVGLVHRLDRVTGGVMVFAKTSKGAARLAESIKGGDFQKKYLAVVCGAPKERVGKLEHYLLKNETKNIVEVVGQAVTGAKYAELNYKTIGTIGVDEQNISLVEVELITGRSHQIRVQMATIGCPLVGDAKYGLQKNVEHGENMLDENTIFSSMSRKPATTSSGMRGKKANLALWAYELSFTHPTTAERMKFVVNPPETAPWMHFDFNRKGHKHRGGE